MTAAVFLILLVCLLTMRFFFTCLIALLIGIFLLSDQPAHAKPAPKCDAMFIQFDALFVHATIACDKNYMDSAAGIGTHNLALNCRGVIPMTEQQSIIRKIFDGFEADAKKIGKEKACQAVDNLWKQVKVTMRPCGGAKC